MSAPSSPKEESSEELRGRILGTESEIHLKTWYPSLKGALAELKALNAQLEDRVAKGTEELRAANAELERKNRDLEESRERLIKAEGLAAYGRLAGRVAHELNTPLGALISATQALDGESADAADAAIDLANRNREAKDGTFQLTLYLVGRGLAAASGDPARIPGRQEKQLLLERLARLSAAKPGGQAQDRQALSYLAEDLIVLGCADDTDELLSQALAMPYGVNLALRLSAPARSAAIAKEAAWIAAVAIEELRQSAADPQGDRGNSTEGQPKPIL